MKFIIQLVEFLNETGSEKKLNFGVTGQLYDKVTFASKDNDRYKTEKV